MKLVGSPSLFQSAQTERRSLLKRLAALEDDLVLGSTKGSVTIRSISNPFITHPLYEVRSSGSKWRDAKRQRQVSASVEELDQRREWQDNRSQKRRQ